MIFATIRRWLGFMWRGISPGLAQDYVSVYSTPAGQRVLQHLVDTVYCTVYEGTDPIGAAVHNARRSVVHEILYNIDIGRNPDKYEVKQEESHAFGPNSSVFNP
jgi:hypothetical protein